MVAAVRLRQAVAVQGGFPVLAGADLEVATGEVVLLQGANGAGKTSLLRVCAGLLPVVSGRAEVLGCDLAVDRRAVRRRVGLLGHATALYDDLTVADNVRFAVRAAGGPPSAVDPALDRMGLAGRLRDIPLRRLSAGQRRRTALAIVVARQPEVWLLDEPHAGLDAEHRDLLDRVIAEAAGKGAAVLLASHERERVSSLADRILTMAGGLILPSRGRSGRPTAAGELGPAGRPTAAGELGPAGPAGPALLSPPSATSPPASPGQPLIAAPREVAHVA